MPSKLAPWNGGRSLSARCGPAIICALLAGALALLNNAGVSQAQSVYYTIRTFGFADQSSGYLTSGVIEGRDGTLYGTAENGGSNAFGTVYRIHKDGSGFRILKSFSLAEDSGVYPMAELLQASDGFLYGTTSMGGPSNRGGIFRLNVNGDGFTVLQTFAGTTAANPWGGLIESLDGFLYGTTFWGGIANTGTIFRLSKDNGHCVVIKEFMGMDGAHPLSRLLQDSNGTLYGTTYRGGISNFGTVFKIGADGSGYAVLKEFVGGQDGRYPFAGLAFDAEGRLFGTTRGGGMLDRGTLFKLDPDGGGHHVLASFGGAGSDNGSPYGSLTVVSNVLFGVTSSGGRGFGTVFRVNKDGTEFKLLKTFPELGDGSNPWAALCFASDDFLYGTTVGGGSARGGTIFRLRADGADYAVIRSFSYGGYDGTHPRTPILGQDGMLYGTTRSGGSNDQGTVLKVGRSNANYTIFKSFTPADGYWPYGTLLQTAQGVLFGTLLQGGSAGHGAIYRLNTNGTGFAVVKGFDGFATNGYSPFGGLMQGSDGMLYGTTQYGGRGGGVIFRMDQEGGGYTVIKSLDDQNRSDGAYPASTLTEGLDGALYGTTSQGGTHFRGTIFKISRNGSNYIVLKSFTGTNGDGMHPRGTLRQISNGTLFGVTQDGGTADRGTIFRIDPDGTGFAIVHSFTGRPRDGHSPFEGMVQRENGLLYGTASGGTAERGIVFQLKPDGSGYAVVHNFTDGYGVSGLLQTPDYKLYGGLSGAGTMRHGALFCIEPGPVILPLIMTAHGVHVQITGIPHEPCRLERAHCISGPWTTATILTPDSSGNAAHDDDVALASAAFYRAVRQ